MTSLTFWDSRGDSLELMAARLNENNPLGDQLFRTGYTEPRVSSKGGVKELASSYYRNNDEQLGTGIDRVTAVKRFQIFTANERGDSLVGICFFIPISKRFKQLYLVASKQDFVGIYMDGEQIAEMEKSNPVVLPDMMRPYLLGVPGNDLELFCQDMTKEAKKFLGGVKSFEL